ncbi:MAG: AAA family ATPase, partial [Actinomycetota bacterium]
MTSISQHGTSLIGRDAELKQVRDLVDAALRGEKLGLLLTGQAGVGKSEILNWAAQYSEQQGALCSVVRVPALGALPPRYPVADVLEGFQSALSIRPRQSSSGSPPNSLAQMEDSLTYNFRLVAMNLEIVARDGPLALFIDDCDGAPLEGIALITASLRALRSGVFLLGTVRTPLASPSWNIESASDLPIDRLKITGLTEDSTAVLAHSFLGKPVLPSVSRTLYERTRGNPLFVRELLRAWQHIDRLNEVGAYWALRDQAADYEPRSLQDILASRLKRLDIKALSVLRILAILGREADYDEIRSISNLQDDECISAIKDLRAVEAIVAASKHERKYALSHPSLSSVAIDPLAEVELGVLHQKVANTLLKSRFDGVQESNVEIAYHAMKANSPPAQLRSLLLAAAEESADAGSHEEEAKWLAAVLENPNLSFATKDFELVNLTIRRARATSNFDPAAAIAQYEIAKSAAISVAQKIEIALGLAHALRRIGRFEECRAELKRALWLTRLAGGPASLHQEIRHSLAVVTAILGKPLEAETLLRQLAAESLGTQIECKSLGHLGQIAFCGGDLMK